MGTFGVWGLLGWFLFTGFAVLPAADLSLPKDYEGRTISSVRFEPQLQPLAPADLHRLVPFQPGAPLRLSDVRDSIAELRHYRRQLGALAGG